MASEFSNKMSDEEWHAAAQALGEQIRAFHAQQERDKLFKRLQNERYERMRRNEEQDRKYEARQAIIDGLLKK